MLVSAHKFLYMIVGLVAGFLIGFAFANGINREEQDELRAELTRLRAATPQMGGGEATATTAAGNPDARAADNSAEPTLTEDDLRRAIARGDAAPNDLALQRNLGRGLYLYAMNSGNTALIPDAARMLKRAHDGDPKDYETMVLLGNALFDVGQKGEPASFSEARAYYLKALDMKPDDVNVRTDLGLTYYFGKPSDPQRAIREYRKSLAIEPRHEMTIQNLVAALIATRNLAEAQQRIDELKSLNPANPALPDLAAQLEQGKTAAK